MAVPRVNGLHYQGWVGSSIEAWIEIIVHSLLCLMISIFSFLFIWIFVCNKDPPCRRQELHLTQIQSNLSMESRDSGNISKTNRMSRQHTDSVKKKNKLDIVLKTLMFGSIFFAILYIFSTYIFVSFYILVLNIRYQNGCLYRVLCISFITFQRSILYVFMLIRLKRSFKGTVFQFSEYKLGISIVTVIVLLNGVQGANVYAGYRVNDFRCTGYLPLTIVLLIAGFIDVCIAVLITYVFVWRLKRIIYLQSRENDGVNSRVKKVSQKLTLLTIVMVSSTVIIIGLALATPFSYQFYGVDALVNITCIMLSFGVLDSEYYKICSLCIKCGSKCCIKDGFILKQISINIAARMSKIRVNDATPTGKERVNDEISLSSKSSKSTEYKNNTKQTPIFNLSNKPTELEANKSISEIP